MKLYALATILVVIGLLSAYLLGRSAAPVKETLRIETTTAEAEAHIFGSFQQSTVSQRSFANEHVRERIVYKEGAVVEVTRWVDKEATSEATKTETSAHTDESQRVVTKLETKYVEKTRSAPNFAVTAKVGVDWHRNLGYNFDVGRRLAGGLWVVGGIDTRAKAVQAGLRWEF